MVPNEMLLFQGRDFHIRILLPLDLQVKNARWDPNFIIFSAQCRINYFLLLPLTQFRVLTAAVWWPFPNMCQFSSLPSSSSLPFLLIWLKILRVRGSEQDLSALQSMVISIFSPTCNEHHGANPHIPAFWDCPNSWHIIRMKCLLWHQTLTTLVPPNGSICIEHFLACGIAVVVGRRPWRLKESLGTTQILHCPFFDPSRSEEGSFV